MPQLPSDSINDGKIYRVPLLRRLIELQQSVVPHYLANVAPGKLVMNITRADFKKQRVVFIVGSLGKFSVEQTRRGLFADRPESC